LPAAGPNNSKRSQSVQRTDSQIAPIRSDSYYVQRSDTLSQIARRARPDKSVSITQTMNAIFALNPKAFIKNNINLLKQGYTLKIPSAAEILQLNQQSEQPQSSRLPLPAKTTSHDIEADKAKLKIVPPSEEILNQTVDDDVLELMTKTLKTSHETIKLLKSENALLNSRIDKLTQNLKNYDAKNKELNQKIDRITRLLEQQTIKAPPALVEQSTPKVSDPNAQLNTQSKTQPLSIDSQSYFSENNFRAIYQQILARPDYLLVVLIGIILLFAIIILLQRRSKAKNKVSEKNRSSSHNKTSSRQTSSGQNDSKISLASDTADKHKKNDSDFSDYFDKNISLQTKQPDSKKEEYFENSDEVELDLDLDLDDTPDYHISQAAEENSSAANKHTLQEVNTFIAYGKYDSAENLLRGGMEKSPFDKSLHHKLFEIYSDTDKAEEFKQHLEKVSQLINSDDEFRQGVEELYRKAWG